MKRGTGLIRASFQKRSNMELSAFEVVEDMMIGGLKIVQDERLYRFTSDSVLLSKFAQPKKGDVVADFCSGSGIVAFHFHALHPKFHFPFVLFEMQSALAELSQKTIELNGFDNFTVENRKIQEIPSNYNEKFSLILCNPPYERGGLENDSYEKAICRKEITVNLFEIAVAAKKTLKFGGRICLVHRADRLAEICYTLKRENLEVKRIQFVKGKKDAKPYLVLVEAVKGGKPALTILQDAINE